MKTLKPIDLSPRGSDTAHALAWGLIAASVLILGIVVGSRGFKDFDPALVSYAGATVAAPSPNPPLLVPRLADFPATKTTAGQPSSSGPNFLEQCHAAAFY
jgi:hypothetical protein